MIGICAAFRCGAVACAIGAPVMAALLFAAAPAGAGLLRNAPGVGSVALAHRSLKENLVGGLTGALDRAFRGAVSDDSEEVDAAFDDALHAVGKTARDMIPGAWLLDKVGKRVKTAAENIRGLFGDARAALDPFGQAEAEVLDGDSLARPAVRPPPRQRAGETARQAGRSTGNDAWAEVMNERDGAAASTGGGGTARSAGGDAWAEVMNERPGAGASTGGGGAARSVGGAAWAEAMNERAEAATPTGGGSERPVESDVRAGNGAREEAGNESGGGGPELRSAGRPDRQADALAQRAEERRGAPPRDLDPPSGTLSCEETGPLVEKAITEARDRGTRGDRGLAPGAVTIHCAMANVQRAALWGMIQCSNDPNLGASVGASAADRAGARRALRGEISKVRQGIAAHLESVRLLSDGDGACECWSRICAD